MSKFGFLGLFLLMSAIAAPVFAQTAALEEKQKAVVMFDIRMDILMSSELAKAVNLADRVTDMAENQGNDGPDPSTIARVFGAASAPESVQAAQGIAMGEMPVEFFVKIQFTDASAATVAMEKLLAKDPQPQSFERDGKTYYRPSADQDAPENAVFHQFDATTLEFGTEAYVFHPGQKVFTDGLTAAWKKVPDNEAFRLAIDREGASSILNELVNMGKQGGDPMMGGFLDLVDNMKNIRLSFDVSGANLLTLQSTGVDAEQAEELASGLDGLLGLAKMGGAAQVNQMKAGDPETAAVLEQILKSLQAKVEGDEVSVIIPKPAGFDEAVKKTAGQ